MSRKSEDIAIYIENQESVANRYVMKCFTVTMLVYMLAFVLNLLGIFVIEQGLMRKAFIPSLLIYIFVCIITKIVSLSNPRLKYFILFHIMLFFTVTGVFITYHVVLVSLLPFLYAALYSSKKVMRYVYILTVFSTIAIVYGGYYFGLCDANMVLLTTKKAQDYIAGAQFTLTEVNTNPYLSLMLFFVIPRCLIYIAFMSVCSSLFHIVSGSLEKAKLTAELEKAKIEAENANRAKTDFLAKMSHEIRTPINAILGMNEMILRESEELSVREYATDVKNSSVMLLSIVNEILDASKIESGKMELVPCNYEMGSLLNDIYNMISVKAKEKNLELIFDVDPNIPSEYFGDDKRIRQVLLNLLTNAVKYTERGAVILKVCCKTEGKNAVLQYSVMDTGIGIRPEDINKIYESFQRLDVSRNRNVEGTGLGMNIVQQLLGLMGSELKIESEYEKGSEFSFEIIQELVNAEPLGDFREKLFRAAREEAYRTSYIAPNARILVVDDYKMNLKVFKNLLKQTQMQVVTAESGAECLEMLQKQSFDLIFLDHMMPGMDGIETLHAIRENALCVNVPIIMLTANAMGNGEKYIEEGFHDFLSKPILPDKLDKMILRYLPEQMITTCTNSEAPIREEACQEAVPFRLAVLNELRKELSEINFETGLITCNGDEDFYLELLQDFVQLSIKEELVRYFEESDYENYHIRIHAFKNSAYSIGAKPMGDLAYEMERCTKKGFPKEIGMLQQDLFEQYDKVCLRHNEIKGIRVDVKTK